MATYANTTMSQLSFRNPLNSGKNSFLLRYNYENFEVCTGRIIAGNALNNACVGGACAFTSPISATPREHAFMHKLPVTCAYVGVVVSCVCHASPHYHTLSRARNPARRTKGLMGWRNGSGNGRTKDRLLWQLLAHTSALSKREKCIFRICLLMLFSILFLSHDNSLFSIFTNVQLCVQSFN